MAHPLLVVLTRTQARQKLRKEGYGLLDSIQLATAVDGDMIDAVQGAGIEVPDFGAEVPAPAAVGGIIDTILAFLTSPAGIALVAAVIKILLGGL